MPRFQDCWRCGNTVGVGIVCDLCGIAKYCSEKCLKDDIFRHEAECIPASILNTCKMCRKSGRNLRACTGCYQAFYCDAKCQKHNWGRHKIDCNQVKEKIQNITKFFITQHILFSEQHNSTCGYYYWGNVPAFDCLNLIENEGESYKSELSVLFLGVGDLRNVVLTIASLPDNYRNRVSFALNDRSACVMARLVLLLFMLIKGKPGVEKTVTEIWYSIQLSKLTYESLRDALWDLIKCTNASDFHKKAASLVTVEESQLKQMRSVWKSWLRLKVEGTEWIRAQREKIHRDDAIDLPNTLYPAYVGNIPTQHSQSAEKWIKDGIFKRTDSPFFAENPTLTGVDMETPGSSHFAYCISERVFPFSGWDYVQVKKFKSSNCLVAMYGDYIECILRAFVMKLPKNQISFRILLDDCTKIERDGKVYDRILTSNLMDYIFLPKLLKSCSERLNHNNQYATIITETLKWTIEAIPQADITHPLKLFQIPKLTRIALQDTGRSSFTQDKGQSLIEYLDNSCDFYNYLRAIFLVERRITGELFPRPTKSKIPTLRELGNEFQLRLRDGIQNENRIVFFKMAVNRRWVNAFSAFSGRARYLEWIPLKNS